MAFGNDPAINLSLHKPTNAGNPYRAILRRNYPEPLVALLVFILGLWLWDHHFGPKKGYEPGTEIVALIKADRDLRLADAMASDPAWLRWFSGADTPQGARKTAVIALGKLVHEKSIGPAGMEAYIILKDGAAAALTSVPHSDFSLASYDLATHGGTWWQASLVEAMETTRQPAAKWRGSYGRDNARLRTRAIFVRSSVWLLGAFGIICLPHTLAAIRSSLSATPTGYLSRWTVPQGLVIFLVSTLAWIGLVGMVESCLALLPPLHPLVGIFVDTSVRLLPALAALAFLFRRPSHAIRSLGLDKLPDIRPVLGVLPVLMLLDLALQACFGADTTPEPGGGLSPADAGLWGLAFSFVSACLVAPVAEEILYRGVLFPSFRNTMGLLPAAAASTFAFALLHFYDGYGMASVAFFGFVCALLFSATRSLTTCILLHMLYNTMIKLPEWLIYHAPLK